MTWEPLTLTCQLRFCYSRSFAICRIGIHFWGERRSLLPPRWVHRAARASRRLASVPGARGRIVLGTPKLEFPSAELPRQLRWDLLDMSGSARTRSNTLQTKPNWCHLMSEKTGTKFSDFPKSSDCAPSFPKNRISSSCCKHSTKKR